MDDGLPMTICLACRLLFEHCYRFKQMCKKAETLLKQFPLTGKFPEPLVRPRIPPETGPANPNKETETISNNVSNQKQETQQVKPSSSPAIAVEKKILNASPASKPEPPKPAAKRFKKDEDSFLSKLNNDEDISLQDVQNLLQQPKELIDEEGQMATNTPAKNKPKLLNKSSFKILNKEANVIQEPRLASMKVKKDEHGNMEIVTEILDPNAPMEPVDADLRTAAPVETNVYPCTHPNCERSFPLQQLRDIHVINHNRERSFFCEHCDKSFFSKYDLKKHEVTHLADRPFKCTVCQKGFSRKNLLLRHEKVHTDIPKFICIYCEMPFISKEEMTIHTATHTRSRPYECKHCHKAFAYKQGLERHEVVHLTEQPYPCQYCELSFSTSGKLARHLTAHAGKRPYPCKYCNKSYLLSHHLTRHMRSHKQDNNTFFNCSLTSCSQKFKTHEQLIEHSILHASEQPRCTLCNKDFPDQETATKHIQEHGSYDSFSCTFCDFIFMTSEQLDEHIGDQHLEDMEQYNTFDKISENAIQLDNSELQQTIEQFLIEELPASSIIKEEKDYTKLESKSINLN